MLECLALLLALSACTGPAAAAQKASSLNEFRTGNGLSELRADPAMVKLAKDHAEDMARRKTMDHAGFFRSAGPPARAPRMSSTDAARSRARSSTGSTRQVTGPICY